MLSAGCWADASRESGHLGRASLSRGDYDGHIGAAQVDISQMDIAQVDRCVLYLQYSLEGLQPT